MWLGTVKSCQENESYSSVFGVYTQRRCSLTHCQTSSGKAVSNNEIWIEFGGRLMSPVSGVFIPVVTWLMVFVLWFADWCCLTPGPLLPYWVPPLPIICLSISISYYLYTLCMWVMYSSVSPAALYLLTYCGVFFFLVILVCCSETKTNSDIYKA